MSIKSSMQCRGGFLPQKPATDQLPSQAQTVNCRQWANALIDMFWTVARNWEVTQNWPKSSSFRVGGYTTPNCKSVTDREISRM